MQIEIHDGYMYKVKRAAVRHNISLECVGPEPAAETFACGPVPVERIATTPIKIHTCICSPEAATAGHWAGCPQKQPGSQAVPAPLSVALPEDPAHAQKGDAVSRPYHYTQHPSGVECITIAQHFSFNLGNAIKYVWRAGLKSTDVVQDLKKAIQYLEFEIVRLGGTVEK